MKRIALRRKSPIRKSARKHGNKWYKAQVVDAFMRQFRGQPCAVCGSTLRTAGHHILAKGSHPAHIVTAENIVVLCQLHHRWSNDMAPHSTNQLAVHRFNVWLQSCRKEQWAWCIAHEWDKIKHDWKELYERMAK